jgi:hypothetical protein
MASTLKFDQWQGTDGTVKTAVVNVEQFSTTAVTFFSGANNMNAPIEITNMSWTYTPKVSGSKILIMFDLMIGHTNNNSFSARMSINGTFPFIGLTNPSGFVGYTSPSIYVNNTSAMIFNFNNRYLYQNSGLTPLALKLFGYEQSGSFYLNRGYSYDDSARARTPSSWTVMEFQP